MPRLIDATLCLSVIVAANSTAVSAPDADAPPKAQRRPAVAPGPAGQEQRAIAAPRPVGPRKSVEELVADLNSPRYAEREAATQALVRLGRPAVEPLQEAVEEGQLEVTVRAVRVVEAIYADIERDEPAVRAAETALERWSRSDDTALAGRAESVLNRHVDLRHRRAVAAIERLGGKVVTSDADSRPGAISNARVERIHIGRNWRGKDAGLKYLDRLESVGVVYIIRGCGVSPEAVDKLRQSFHVERRGAAYLGIQGGRILEDGTGVEIRTVVSGGAAEAGGIQPGDIVVAFGGEAIASFDDLINQIKKYDPGDEVTVEIRRSGPNNQREKKTLTVVMDSWEEHH